METRIEVQEKIERIIDAVNGRDGARGTVPERHLLCVMFGGELEQGHEAARQLHQSFAWRYRRGMSIEPFLMIHANRMEEPVWEEAFRWVRYHISGGFLPSTNQYYVPIIFLMQDEDTQGLPEFVTGLRRFLRREGITGCEIDLYGLIDYSRPQCAERWAGLFPALKPLRGEGYSDLYLLTKDELSDQNIFGKALDALEMNIFLKVSTGKTGLFRLWDFTREGEIGPGQIPYKILSYWKMDILVCVICRYVQEILDFQLSGSMERRYQDTADACLLEFLNSISEDRRPFELAKHLPFDEADMEEILAARGGPLQGLSKIGLWNRLVKKQQEEEPTAAKVLEKLYGREDFIEVFADGLSADAEELSRDLAQKLLQSGTFVDVDTVLPGIVEKRLEQQRQEEETCEKLLRERLNQPLSYGTRDMEQFLERLFGEVVAAQYELYCMRQKTAVLERVLEILNGEAFLKYFEEERQKKRDRWMFLNGIIGSSMPRNGREMTALMAQYQFYNHQMDMELAWNEDVFQHFERPGSTQIRMQLEKIAENVRLFEREEREEILRIFEEGIKRLREHLDILPLYAIKGRHNALDQDSREYLFADREFISETRARRQEGRLDVYDRLRLMPNEVSAPYTMEFFGLNDSVDPEGIAGLYREE